MKKIKTIIKYFFLSLGAVVIIVPFWLMILTSFKSKHEARTVDFSFPKEFVGLGNYLEVLGDIDYMRIFLNTLLITLSSIIIVIFLSSLAAYIVARRKERVSSFLFYLFISGMMYPPAIIITVVMFKYLHLLGNYQGMIFYYIGALIPFPFFMLTSFMATLPRELEEAAIIDGASPITIYLRIILPLLRPPITTIFIWGFMVIWNDFMSPLYILSGNTKLNTLVLSIYRYKSQYRTEWNLVFALLILVSLPVVIIFIFLQKRIAEGMTAGAIKG